MIGYTVHDMGDWRLGRSGFKGCLTVLALSFFCVSLYSQDRSNFISLPFSIDNQHVKVTHSLQDGFGFVWLAHGTGISKYDGHNFEFIPKESIFDPSVPSDEVNRVFKDGQGVVWAQSLNGQLSYLQENGSFLSIDHKIEGFQSKYPIETVYADKDILWLVSKARSVFSYDHKNGVLDSVTTLPINRTGRNGISSIVVRESRQLVISSYKGPVYLYDLGEKMLKILETPYNYSLSDNTMLLLDKSDRLWIGSSHTDYGIVVYDFEKEAFVQDVVFRDLDNGHLNELFTTMYCDADGFVWLGTDGSGLYRIDPNNGDLKIYERNDRNSLSLSTNTVIDINEDLKRNLWVLTNYGNMNILRRTENTIKYNPGTIDLKPARVLSAYRAVDRTLWIGTDGDGLLKTPENGKSEQFFSSRDHKRGYYIHTINEDLGNNIWVGTYKNGLWIYDSSSGTFRKKELMDENGSTVLDVRYIFRDSKNRMWVTADLGVYIFGADNSLLARFANNTSGLVGSISQSILESAEGSIWLAYNEGGLFRFEENGEDLSKSRFIGYSDREGNRVTNRNHDILSMANLGDENLWMVTSEGRLIKFDMGEQQFRTIPMDSTGNNPIFRSILMEDRENLWLGSTNGIWHYDLRDSSTTLFRKRDGLWDNFFMQRSAHKGRDGYLYFGGLNGINYFKPGTIYKEEVSANLYIEEIEILNKPAISVVPAQIKGGVEKLDRLELEHDQSSFSLKFLAMDDILFANYNYAYRLKGFNNTWITSGKERRATYTNIPPGDYVFEVKAGSELGKWDLGRKKVSIHIAEPFWNTWWAHIFYLLLAIALVYGIILWARLKNRLRTEALQRTHEKELYTLKMDFFAKMSHEIQTPLTLILIPLEEMIEQAVQTGNLVLNRRLRSISNNAKRLSRIVFELTSLRDRELEKLVLRPSLSNIIGDLKEMAGSYTEQAKYKDIEFTCNYPGDELIMEYDKDKLEHIVYNLLSNAFKFTPRGGAIILDVAVDEGDRSIKICITDSGPGIPKEELENIFQLFYQTDMGSQKIGTGIGLALTKELVALHNGRIAVRSDTENGTCFCVSLPIFNNMPQVSVPGPIQRAWPGTDTALLENNVPIISEPNENKERPSKTILIVEDDYELQISLRDIFMGHYHVLLAEDGEEGMRTAIEMRPDIIIADVMMPKMDGIEMGNSLLRHSRTAHIPIIMLTAKKTPNSELMGLRAGAVEFIAKPFQINELVLKVNNIITKNHRMILNYKSDLISTPTEKHIKSRDEVFLGKVVAHIEKELDNPEFKLEDLSKSLNMSYSAIYRKFQLLTGKKIVEFVRTMRLKKAAVLMAEGNYPVSEAAFLSGFNDPKYFSKCFKKEFGESPTKFKEKSDIANRPEQ